MTEGIRDTSAQDVLLEKTGSRRWLKWALPGAAVSVLLWLLASALTTWLSAEASVTSDRIRTAVVGRGDLVRDLSVPGRVVAAVSPTLYSPATGTVTLRAQPGDKVMVGQVLAVVGSPEVRAAFLQEQATLDRLAAELEREMRRAEESIRTKAISEIDYERASDELARARVEYDHAVQDARLEGESLEFETTTRQLAVDRQNLVVGELQRQVDDLSIRSPVDGIVGNVAVDQKALINHNSPLITVVDLSAYEVEVRIPESYADDMGIGLAGDVQYDAASYRGELVSLSPEVVNNEVVGRIRFSNEAPAGLRQNQRVTVRMMMDELFDVLKLQRGAFADNAGGRFAWVLDSDGLATRRDIRLGARSAAEVQVLTGLTEGETVIISSIPDFEDYDTIQVLD
jgi:HlyD family secretion protein